MQTKSNVITRRAGIYDFFVTFPIKYPMSGTLKNTIKVGSKVTIVLKSDQSTGKLTEGVVKDILTSSPSHPHGIKVRLTNGLVGRVKEVL